MEWYPQDKKELNRLLESFLAEKPKIKQDSIHGVIVPHAGYVYSGKISGKAYSLLKGKEDSIAIILAPAHYVSLKGIASHNQQSWKTALGSIKIIDSEFPKQDISSEHAIGNQIPFLQKLGFKKILPLMVGEITKEQAEQTAESLTKMKNAVFIISTDLSHFLSYEQALKKDKETIRAIENLNSEKLGAENSACGAFPLLILLEICRLKNWKPKLIEYKNSGDITGEKESVVGYAGFWF
jgi:AmmeMemoRadiSam system protein B